MKAKVAGFPILNPCKCEPLGPNEITYINSIFYFKMTSQQTFVGLEDVFNTSSA